MDKKVIIIGAGIAGLAASIRLSIKGYQVTLFEANSYPGGKMTEITLPEQVEELFTLAGLEAEEFFKYKKLDVNCNYFWEDGTKLSAYSDLDKFAEEAEQQLGEKSEHIKKALNKSAYIYKYLAPLFMHRSLHSWRTWVNKKAMASYLRIGKFGLFNTMNQANHQLFNHPKLVQLFNRYATYNGSNPYQTPATLNIIPHLEFNKGAYFPDKGMHDITSSLYNLAKRLGVHFHFNKSVDRVQVINKKATGIWAGGKSYEAEYVINNMDMVTAYKTILKEEDQPKWLLKQPKSSSALIFYWGVKKVFPELDLHNILFSKDYEKEFKAIFKEKDIYEDPTVYINITSVKKENDAPTGAMNWFTMINVPNNQGQNWDLLKSRAREFIVRKINATLNTDIEPLIEVEHVLDPIGIATKTSSANGALYGNSSNNRYAAFLRHPNYSSKIKNLYFCGGSVHPGGGIPLCLLSAKIMSEMIPKA